MALSLSRKLVDGVIEAFEGETPSFCLGIQWHPEYRLSDFDRAIFRTFVGRSGDSSLPRGTPLDVKSTRLLSDAVG